MNPSIDPAEAVAFSGSRPEKFPFPYTPDSPAYRALREALYRAVTTACQRGQRTFLCGMAVGFDTLAGLQVLRARGAGYGARLVCAVPYAGVADRWPRPDRYAFDHLCREAGEVVTLSPRYFSGCFHARNRWLVDHAGLLICYHCGVPGGTAYTVRYAKSRGLPIQNLAEEGPEQLTLAL